MIRNFMLVQDLNDGEIFVEEYKTSAEVINSAANFYALDDSSVEYKVMKIVRKGREIEYAGWKPNMVFDFLDVISGKIVASTHRMEWDH